MSAPRPAVLVVLTDVPAGEEERFNDWYDAEHVPERVAVPGVRRARRYVRHDGAPQPPAGTVDARRGPRYLVVYELDDVAVLEGTEWAEVAGRRSEASLAMYPHLQNLVREVYLQISDVAGGGAG